MTDLKTLWSHYAAASEPRIGRFLFSHPERRLISSLIEAVPIEDCGEPLVEISPVAFPRFTPHPYEVLGAPYQGASPFVVRKGVVTKLDAARALLAERAPHLQLKIWDGYRPVAVQQFMVDHTFHMLAEKEGVSLEARIGEPHYTTLMNKVFQIWARPKLDILAPPPHSTGGAVDLTLINSDGTAVEMGSSIDAMPPHCYPDHFENAGDAIGKEAHQNRELLRSVMEEVGFVRLPHEWWHFSYGDQMWAFVTALTEEELNHAAHYGQISEK